MEDPQTPMEDPDSIGNMKESPQVTREELLKMKKVRTNVLNITRILPSPVSTGAYADASKNGKIFLHPYKAARQFSFFSSLTKGCLIKHARALLVLSPTRNRLPTIASFLSCDSLTPQIRPGRLMTASHLRLNQTRAERDNQQSR